VSARGFTLLETLVALALTAIVLAALAGTVRQAASARTAATTAGDRTATARTLLLRLTRELEAARAPAPGPGAPLEAFEVRAPERQDGWSRLRLVTGTADDLRAVAYAVEPDPARAGGHVLVRADAPAGAEDAPGQPVLDDVRIFTVRCFDGTGWTPGCVAQLPRAVEVTLGVDDGRGGVDRLAVRVTPAAAPG